MLCRNTINDNAYAAAVGIVVDHDGNDDITLISPSSFFLLSLLLPWFHYNYSLQL